jgi:hypothetical protein
MRVRAAGPFPVRFQVVSGVKVLIVPATLKVGDLVIVNGNRCIVKKMHKRKIKIMYPNGSSRWVTVRYN